LLIPDAVKIAVVFVGDAEWKPETSSEFFGRKDRVELRTGLVRVPKEVEEHVRVEDEGSLRPQHAKKLAFRLQVVARK
jgi:hypothetical protein